MGGRKSLDLENRECPYFCVLAEVPKVDNLVSASSDHHVAIRREGHRRDGTHVALQDFDELLGVHIPSADFSIVSAQQSKGVVSTAKENGNEHELITLRRKR